MKRRAIENIALRRCIAACLAIAIAPPVFTWFSFSIGKYDPFLFVPWSVGEAMSYCGAISAAAIAIVGVLYSLRENRIDKENNAREGVAPCFSPVFLTVKNREDPPLDFLSSCIGEKRSSAPSAPTASLRYEEVEERRLYVILATGISYKNRLSSEEAKRVRCKSLLDCSANGLTFADSNPVVYVPVLMRNIGAGVASCVRVGVNRKDDEWKGACSWTIGNGEDLYLGIYIDTSDRTVFGQYVIGIIFSDCLGYDYRQDFELEIKEPRNSREQAQVGISLKGRRTILDDNERRSYLQSGENLITRVGS